MSDLDFPNTADNPARQLAQALAFAALALLLYWVASELWRATEPQAPSGRGGEVVRQRGAVSSNGAVYGQ